jgi:hypothetical protein
MSLCPQIPLKILEQYLIPSNWKNKLTPSPLVHKRTIRSNWIRALMLLTCILTKTSSNLGQGSNKLDFYGGSLTTGVPHISCIVKSFLPQFSGTDQLPEALIYKFREFIDMLRLHDKDYILLFKFFNMSPSCLHQGTTDGGRLHSLMAKCLF